MTNNSKIWNNVVIVSDWQLLQHMNTSGTRNKNVLVDENGVLHYFKESYNNQRGKHYPFEFYSEIIASFIGGMIGLDVLKYEIAIYKNRIGCISQSMILDDEELIEGGKYLKAFDNTFILNNENPKEKYTFQLITTALDYFKIFNNSYEALWNMIIFDAIIGNSDRHQENWGFIAKTNNKSLALDELEKTIEGNSSRFPKWLQRYFKSVLSKHPNPHQQIAEQKLQLNRKLSFSPIYDSGCCFGREITEDKIQNYISDQNILISYINKGMAEIHWDGIKRTHFDLLRLILEEDENMNTRIKRLIEKIDFMRFKEFISTLDDNLPPDFHHVKISDARKEFMVKLLTLRVETIKKIIDV